MTDLVYWDKPQNIQKMKAKILAKYEEIDIELPLHTAAVYDCWS